MRRIAVAGAANVVVEAVLRALPRRVRGGCGRGEHFSAFVYVWVTERGLDNCLGERESRSLA